MIVGCFSGYLLARDRLECAEATHSLHRFSNHLMKLICIALYSSQSTSKHDLENLTQELPLLSALRLPTSLKDPIQPSIAVLYFDHFRGNDYL